MTEKYKTFAEVVELENDKLMFVTVVNKKQLGTIYNLFEPYSRSWRGQYQALAKAVVAAYEKWKNQ
jgi:hypothetical protein